MRRTLKHHLGCVLAGMLLGMGTGCDRTKSADGTPSPSSDSAANHSDLPLCTVVAVDDGNRIRVLDLPIASTDINDPAGIEIRLRGVAAPDLNSPSGPEARAFCEDFLSGKKAWVELKFGKSKQDDLDMHAKVFRYPDGALLNAELVRHGLARVTSPGSDADLAKLPAIQEEARQSRKGIWR